MSPNHDLSGHRLLFLVSYKLKPEYLDRLRVKFPGLTIDCHVLKDSAEKDISKEVPDATLKDVTVLLTWATIPDPIQSPKLQYVQLTSAGANHLIGRPLFGQPGVEFCNASGVHPPQISEWVIATYLAHKHEIPQYLDAMKEGKWIKKKPDGIEDSVGLRMGILGYGAIGRQCARLAKALGMDVIAFTRGDRSTLEKRRDDSYSEPGLGDLDGSLPSKWYSGSTTEAVNEFLSQNIDLLVIAMPLTDLTKNLIAAPQFEILSKRRAFISNIGRGPIINTDDFVDALDKGLIGGAALDVTDPEPLPEDHPLWKKKNVIITPHVSGLSTHYNDRVLAILETNLTRISEGKELINKVDIGLGY